HIPFVLDLPESDNTDPAALGTLRGHLARANPQSKALIEAVAARASSPESESGSKSDTGSPPVLERDVMVLFNAPVHHYVTPKFYTETKPATGKVVPTWDYAAVQVYGKATVHCDARADATSAFLSKQITDLSAHAETEIMGHERPWQVADAPDSYVELLKKAIIGIEIRIESMGGKWKMSQESGEGDLNGVIHGFEGLGTEDGSRMAEIIRERRELRDARKNAHP
ncbi:putative FMN-binding domain-containing protein, partial [Trametes elegans]